MVEGKKPSGNTKAVQQAAVVTPAAERLNASDAPGDSLGRYRAFWPQRGDAELADRVVSAAALLRPSVPKFGSMVTTAGLRDQMTTPFEDTNIQVTYHSKYDDLRIADPSSLPYSKPESDIGESAAKTRMLAAFDSLVTRGLAQKENFDMSDVRTGHHYRRDHTGQGPDVEYVVEYNFRLLRKINGIDFANNGVVIGVSPVGAISSLRIGGAVVDSTRVSGEERPSMSGQVVNRLVAADQIADHFRSKVHPDRIKNVVWQRKMYVMPNNQQEAIIEPMSVYRYGLSTTASGPVEAKILGYSLAKSVAEPADLMAN